MSYLRKSYLGAWDDDRPEGIAAKIGWGLRKSASAVADTFSAGATAVKTTATDIATGTSAAQREEAERRKAALAASAASARTRNIVILGALAAGAYFYFKRK